MKTKQELDKCKKSILSMLASIEANVKAIKHISAIAKMPCDLAKVEQGVVDIYERLEVYKPNDIKYHKEEGIMRTVVYGSEELYASHKLVDGGSSRLAIVVDSDDEQVNVVFSEDEPGREFDYADWLALPYY